VPELSVAADVSRVAPSTASSLQLSIRDLSDGSEYLHFSCRRIGFLTKQGEGAGEFLDI
jgi:hypothetical protein